MLLTTFLPRVCLPTFLANKARSPNIVWRNTSGLTGLSLEEHAYFIPLKSDHRKVTLAASKSFQAERYGGEGLAGNGGGVRCGLDGTFQIKGIGRNLLAGAATDFFHSYGGASLNEGIVEAIWGEVLHAALPYGAVRIYGLIGTGTRVPLLIPKEGCDPTTARALIVRQSALRPAHYMRSIYYDPITEMHTAPKDAVRTRAAVGSIAIALASLYESDLETNSAANSGEQLNAYIQQMFARCAAQIACARAKRIMHGSLIASNFALDGRWLDFSTSSAMSDYGRILISPGTPDFMHEEQTLQRTVFDLNFYLRKYVSKSIALKLDEPGVVWKEFISQFNLCLETEFLKLTGIPIECILKITRAKRSDLYRVMKAIIASGNSTSYSILTGAAMPGKTGDFSLNVILSKSTLCASRDSLNMELIDVLSNMQLRIDFVEQYWQCREEYLAQFSNKDRVSANCFMRLNCLRLNMCLPELYRPHLYEEIDQLIVGAGDVNKYINKKIKMATTLLAEPVAGEINLSDWFDSAVTVSAAVGIHKSGVATSMQRLLMSIRPGILSTQQIQKMVSYA